jgi:hypothetical protein
MLVIEAKSRAPIGEVCTELAWIMPEDSNDFQDIDSLFTILQVREDDKEHVGVQASVSFSNGHPRNGTNTRGLLGHHTP